MGRRNGAALGFGIAAAALLGACVGEIGSEPVGGPGSDPLVCDGGVVLGAAPLRRMNRFEYNQTLVDLLGDTTNPADDFAEDEEALGFNNNSGALTTSDALTEKYMRTAEAIATRAMDDEASLLPCDPAVLGEDACALAFVEALGPRAYRRPITAAESDVFMAMYQHGKADGGFRLGIEMVIQLALQSPHFLYRVELGEPIDGDGEIIALDDWEIASRLSYLIWGSMPDDTLFAAAAAGELGTPADIETQARRMLDDPRAHQVIENFHQQWLDYDRIKSAGKDGTLFPDYSPIIGELMRLETASFVDHVVFGDAGDLATLLTAPYSFMNADLAAFYGVSGPSGADFELTGGDAPRSGLLSIGALMTLNAHSNQTSPVHRGKLVREQLLCDIMPPPPDDVMITVPEPDPNSTARERFAQHSADPACSGCHELLDPIGFGFENYDAVGRYRTMEAGQPIDASGAIIQSDVDGAFNGVVDLGQKLAQSEDVMACYTQQWFRYGYGRGESKQDACTMQALVADMVASGGDIRELVVALTRTVSFTHKRIGGAQ